MAGRFAWSRQEEGAAGGVLGAARGAGRWLEQRGGRAVRRLGRGDPGLSAGVLQ